MKYLLDTNTCIFLMKNREAVVARYKANKKSGIAVSSITVAELYFGVYNSASPEKNGENLTNFLLGFSIVDFDSNASAEYGRVRSALQKKGTLIGQLDMLIAAHAKSLGLIAVTNNTREFERVEGLMLEDWYEGR